MAMLRINNQIINIDNVIDVIRHSHPFEPDMVFIRFTDGKGQSFEAGEADAVWEYFNRDTPDLAGLVNLNERQAQRNAEYQIAQAAAHFSSMTGMEAI